MKQLTFVFKVVIVVAVIVATIGYLSFISRTHKPVPPTSLDAIEHWEQFFDQRAAYNISYPSGWVLDQFENGIVTHPIGEIEPLWGVWFEHDESAHGALTVERGIEQIRESLSGTEHKVSQSTITVGGVPAVFVTVTNSLVQGQTFEFVTLKHHNIRFRIWNGSGSHPGFNSFVASFIPLVTGLTRLPFDPSVGCQSDDTCVLVPGTEWMSAECVNMDPVDSLHYSTSSKEDLLGRQCTECTNITCGATMPSRSWCQCSTGRCERTELGWYGLAWMCNRLEKFTYITYQPLNEGKSILHCVLNFGEARVNAGKAYSAEQATYRVREAYRALLVDSGFFVGYGVDTYVRYRTVVDGYPQSGWYIDSLTNGSLKGSYYLSEDGYLKAYNDSNSLSGCY